MIKYSLFSLSSTSGAQIRIGVSMGAESLEINIKSLIDMKQVTKDKQPFDIAEDYLASKSEEFNSKIFNMYLNAQDRVTNAITESIQKSDDSLLVTPIVEMLDLIDYNDIVEWLQGYKNTKLTIPTRIPHEYDESVNYTTNGSRDQTYIRSEYLDLVALSIVFKLVSVPLTLVCDYVKTITKKHLVEYSIFRYLGGHKNINTPALDKLTLYMERIRSSSSVDDDTKRVIETGISVDHVTDWLIAHIVISKLVILNPLKDTNEANIVSILYRSANNKMAIKSGVKDAIRGKNASRSSEDGDEESFLDSYRTVSTLSIGQTELIKLSMHDLETIKEAIGIRMPTNELLGIRRYLSKTDTYMINRGLGTIMAWCLNPYIDPRMLGYVDRDGISNAATVTFAYLLEHGFAVLAYLFTGTYGENEFTNVSSSHSLTNEHREELNKVIANERVNNRVNAVTMLENVVAEIDKELRFSNMVTVIPENLSIQLYKEVYKEFNGYIIKPDNVKILLKNLIIKINEE